jgi:hypothetical protein
VNERLKGHVAPQVLPFHHGDIYLFPDDLLLTTYVHFALEIGQKPPAQSL